MKHFIVPFLAVFISLTSLFGQQMDTSRWVILPYDSTVIIMNGLPANSVNSTLTNKEIIKIELIVDQSIREYNSQQLKVFKNYSEIELKPFVIDASRYLRQYVVVITPSGDTIVWVNCFCNDHFEDWKKNVVFVFDGGNCYFNLKINLNKNTYYDFYVNGEA